MTQSSRKTSYFRNFLIFVFQKTNAKYSRLCENQSQFHVRKPPHIVLKIYTMSKVYKSMFFKRIFFKNPKEFVKLNFETSHQHSNMMSRRLFEKRRRKLL